MTVDVNVTEERKTDHMRLQYLEQLIGERYER
jgi:hypothetical protein